MACLAAVFFFVQSSASRSYRFLLHDEPSHAMVQDRANVDKCADDEYCTVPLVDGWCPQLLGAEDDELESQCAKCSVDPNKLPNSLQCKTCALDNTLQLPMCTSCEGGWISLIWDDLRFQDMIWDAPSPPWSTEKNSTKRWMCLPREIQPNEVPALCSKDPHKEQLQFKRQAWWKFHTNKGGYVRKLVHLSEVENLRNQSVRGDPDHVFIKMRVFSTASKFMREVDSGVFTRNKAEFEYVFQIQQQDSWVRHAPYLKKHPEMMPNDDQKLVWYLDDALETDNKRLEMQAVFVKNVRNSKGRVLGKSAWKKVPKMRFTDLTMQALGSCFDFWLKGRLPRRDLFSRSSASIWYRVSQFFDHQDWQLQLKSPAFPVEADPNRCPDGEYCTFGHRNAACIPPGRCLPCSQDDDGRANGLLCSSCSLSTRAGIRSSVPSCQIDGKPTCDEGQTVKYLIDDTEVRRRMYCRPPAYTAGEMPMLCKAAEQGGLYVASPGEHWTMQKKGERATLGKRIRFLPLSSRTVADELAEPPARVRIIDAYLLFFPWTESLRDESQAFHAGSSLTSEQMLQVQFKSTDNLLYVPGAIFPNITIPYDFDDQHALFKYHGMKHVVGEVGLTLHTLSFNKRFTDFNTGELVGGAEEEESDLFFLSDDALLALTACFDAFIHDRRPEDPSPLSGLRERLWDMKLQQNMSLSDTHALPFKRVSD